MQSKCLALIFLRYYKYYLAANSAQKQWRDGQLRGSLIRKVWTPQKKTEKICTFLTTHIHQNNYFLFKPVLSLHVIICSLPSLSQYIALQSNPVVPSSVFESWKSKQYSVIFMTNYHCHLYTVLTWSCFEFLHLYLVPVKEFVICIKCKNLCVVLSGKCG